MRLLVRVLAVGLVSTVLGLGVSSPARASAVCPPPPTELEGLISPDAVEMGPLTEAYPPIYGVYSESAAACWPTTEISVVGFVAGPEGLGGVRPFTIEPGWMVSLAHFLSVTDRTDAGGPVGPFFRVAVPPSAEARFRSLDHRWVRLSGHFNDRRAKTCVASGAPGSAPTRDEAIAICRTAFVLTSVDAIDAPPTDTIAAVPEGRASTDPSPALGLAAGLGLALALRRFVGTAPCPAGPRGPRPGPTTSGGLS